MDYIKGVDSKKGVRFSDREKYANREKSSREDFLSDFKSSTQKHEYGGVINGDTKVGFRERLQKKINKANFEEELRKHYKK